MTRQLKKGKMNVGYLNMRESGKDDLKECGLRLINHLMKEYNKDQSRLRTLVNEILHSIFFLGIAHKNPFTPKDILSDRIYETVKQEFPEPFETYNTHLPRRTPFSGLIEIMELKYDSKEKVFEGLRSLKKELEIPQPLKKPGSTRQNYYTHTAICVCFNDSLSTKTYFGASVGCKEAKCIMIYSSCINNTLHPYVSHAVMSFNEQNSIQSVADSIKFPGSVKCQAYLWDIEKTNTIYEKEIQPCWKCQCIFNLPGPQMIEQKNKYPYGNCAETECLSKLLCNDQSVRERTVINNHTDDTMRKLKESTRKRLREKLASIPAFINTTMNNEDEDLLFFNPSA